MFVPFLYLIASTLSPGAVTVLTIHNTTRNGRLAGIAVAAGGTVTTAVFVTIAFIFTTNSSLNHISLDTATRYQQIGAILVLLMGLHIAYRSLFSPQQPKTQQRTSSQILKSFFSGMALMIPHFPPAILFYTVILPQYTNPAELTTAILFMGLFKIILTISWYVTLSLAAKPIQNWLFNPRIQRVIEFGVACFLIGTSVTLFMQSSS